MSLQQIKHDEYRRWSENPELDFTEECMKQAARWAVEQAAEKVPEKDRKSVLEVINQIDQ